MQKGRAWEELRSQSPVKQEFVGTAKEALMAMHCETGLEGHALERP